MHNVLTEASKNLSSRLAQAHHRIRWVRQKWRSPDVAVVGGYHFGNLGDMLLGNAARLQLERLTSLEKSSVGLQTIYNLDKWPEARSLIVGGGAVLTNNNIEKLRAKVRNNPDRLAIIGADVLQFDFSAENIAFLNEIPYFSTRSSTEAEKLKDVGVLGLKVVPDIAFSYPVESAENAIGDRVGLNIVPMIRGEDAASSDNPSASSYREILNAFVREHSLQGREVFHVPFTPDDDLAARKILQGQKIRFQSYTSNPEKVIRSISKCSEFLPSRFHSLILCILIDVPAVPFLYAPKSERLFKDFFLKHQGLTLGEKISAGSSGRSMTDILKPVSFDRNEVNALISSVNMNFSSLVTAMNLSVGD